MSEGDGISLFAAVKTFHSEGKDLLSAISQLLLASIKDGSPIEKVRDDFESDYRIKEVPVDAVKTILKRLKRDDLVEYDNLQAIRLSAAGLSQQTKLKQSVAALDRELNDLIQDMIEYFRKKGYPTLSTPSKSLIQFIDKNMALTSAVLTRNHAEFKVESKIAEYILYIEKNDAQHFSLLQNMFFGRLYLSVMRVRSDFAKNTKLDAFDAYLDTSILLSCLGLHDADSTKQATDLLKIINGHEKMRAVVARDTIGEARRLLENANFQSSRYVSSVPVRSIYYQLNQKGYDKNRINLLIETLEERIGKLGITIIDITLDRQSEQFKNVSSEVGVWANLLEHPKRPTTLDHDATLLTHIKNIRKNIHSKIFEKNKAIFVSPDSAVLSYSREQAKKSSKFPLSITPLELTSLLWLRDIASDSIASSTIRQSIMAYVRERAISHSLWEKFVGELEKAVAEDKLDEGDIGIILASSETFEILATDEQNAAKTIISQEFVDRLQNEQDTVALRADYMNTKIEAALARIDRISRQAALVISIVFWSIVTLITAFLFFWLLNTFQIDFLVNVGTVITLTIIFLILLLSGKEIKVFDIVLKFRRFLYTRTFTIVYKILTRFMGLED